MSRILLPFYTQILRYDYCLTLICSLGLTLTSLGVSYTGKAGTVTWSSAQVCPRQSTVLSTAPVVLSATMQTPRNFTMTFNSPLTQPGDFLSGTPANLPICTLFSAVVGYSTYSNNVSNDPRAVVTFNSSLIRVVTDQSTGVRTICALPGAQGVYAVTIQFNNISVSSTLLVVVAVQIVTTTAPFPAYPNSNQVLKSTLYLMDFLTPTRYQQATVTAHLVLSDGRSLDLTDSSRIIRTSNDTRVVISPRGTVALASSLLHDFYVKIQVTMDVGGFSADVILHASPLTVSVAAWLPGTFPAVVTTTAQLLVGCLLTDGTVLPELFPGGVVAYPGLVNLTSSDPSTATVTASGVVTAFLNTNGAVPLTVQLANANGLVTASVPVVTNLLPGLYDVDLGQTVGTALPDLPATPGYTFTVPVRLNTGTATLGSVKTTVTYPATLVEVVSVVAGAGWSSGVFTYNVISGGVVLGGITDLKWGGVLEIAVIVFRVLGGSGLVQLSGVTEVLGDSTGLFSATHVYGTLPATYVAGTVYTYVHSGSSVTGVPSATIAGVPVNLVPRLVPLTNTLFPLGDTNGDGFFSLLDAKFTQYYLATMIVNATQAAALAPNAQCLGNMDANHDGSVTPDDALYLLRVAFGLYVFLDPAKYSVEVARVGCSVQFTAGLADQTAAIVTDATARVFFVVSPTLVAQGTTASSLISQGLLNPIFSTGALASTDLVLNPFAMQGAVYAATYSAASGLFVVKALLVGVPATTLGVSLFVVSLDVNGRVLASHTTPLLKGSTAQLPTGGFLLPPYTVTVTVPGATVGLGGAVLLSSTTGYNPASLLVYNKSIAACRFVSGWLL